MHGREALRRTPGGVDRTHSTSSSTLSEAGPSRLPAQDAVSRNALSMAPLSISEEPTPVAGSARPPSPPAPYDDARNPRGEPGLSHEPSRSSREAKDEPSQGIVPMPPKKKYRKKKPESARRGQAPIIYPPGPPPVPVGGPSDHPLARATADRRNLGGMRGDWAGDQMEEDNSEDGETSDDEDKLRAKENRRHQKAQGKSPAAGTSSRPEPETSVTIHGPWYGKRITTVEQARNLIELVREGDPWAWAYYRYIQTYTSWPLHHRTPGESYLILKFQTSMSLWDRSQNRPPPTPVHPQPPLEVAEAMRAAAQQTRLQMSGTSTSLSAGAAPFVHPPAPAPDHAPPLTSVSEESTAIPRTWESTEDLSPVDPAIARLPFPGADASEVALRMYFSTIPSGSWPRGFRTSYNNFPPLFDNTWAGSPYVPDVRAYRAFVRSLPVGESVDPSPGHSYWRSHFWRLFSVPGLYAHILREGQYPIGDRADSHFPHGVTSLNEYVVAQWMAECGLRPDSELVGDLEALARHRWNILANCHPINALPFRDFPASVEAVGHHVPHIDHMVNEPIARPRPQSIATPTSSIAPTPTIAIPDGDVPAPQNSAPAALDAPPVPSGDPMVDADSDMAVEIPRVATPEMPDIIPSDPPSA
jgi:hypothetical protein